MTPCEIVAHSTPQRGVHKVPLVNCVLARPCGFGTPIEPAEPSVYVLGLMAGLTIGLRMDILSLYPSSSSRHRENEF